MTRPAAPQSQPDERQIDTAQRVLLLAVRQAALIVAGAIETYLGLERSHTPQHVRRNGR